MTELARFERFCRELLALNLEPFQLRITKEVFSPRRECLILLPRGNGKSTLLAAISLWHLLSAKEPRVAIGAASREQAAVLFDIARGMASHPAIASRVEITRREIRTPAGWLKVVASDGPKQHGLILSLAIVDELNAHRDSELYTALRTGMLKRRDARIVTISTAGADDDSALGELRRRALELPKVRRKGSFTGAVGSNLALLEWSLPESKSIDDMAAVKTCNPASWLSEGDLQTFMGHSKIQTTFDVYGHLMPGSHDEVRERMDAYLTTATDAPPICPPNRDTQLHGSTRDVHG